MVSWRSDHRSTFTLALLLFDHLSLAVALCFACSQTVVSGSHVYLALCCLSFLSDRIEIKTFRRASASEPTDSFRGMRVLGQAQRVDLVDLTDSGCFDSSFERATDII